MEHHSKAQNVALDAQCGNPSSGRATLTRAVIDKQVARDAGGR